MFGSKTPSIFNETLFNFNFLVSEKKPCNRINGTIVITNGFNNKPQPTNTPPTKFDKEVSDFMKK
jgi:hypothetical protein